MSDTIIVAFIALVGSLGGSLIGILSANRLIAYRLEQLEKKVNCISEIRDDVIILKRDVDYLKGVVEGD